ncbi:hypothetical protein DDZ14_04735 [Maritimibacter sp. 55A14]|uniref:lysophospholipid acyltransferase family protein n=1 Tax=Maritimibacter sp. 55A14 TaxID=2174844 RepID=UPI000D60AE06|nr:lysophospholipid acyltransferase family protein [Maritimibacter sp. 55A14]PWE33502.1 hypothetical protein DDZ14_04735 [Maritimibacter sp. 55A14]
MRLKKLEKRIRKSAWFQKTTRAFYARYIRFVYRTTRWTFHGHEAFDADLAAGVPHVLCCWHSRIALSTFYRTWEDHPFYILASEHEDARIVTSEMVGRGLRIIWLKTSGDNRVAIREAVRAVRGGALVGLAPDGPLGPREEVKPGAIILASMARAAVTPYAFSTRWRIVLKTWDRFVLPLPFGRGVFLMGESFTPPARLSQAALDAQCAKLAAALDAVSAEADRLADGG